MAPVLFASLADTALAAGDPGHGAHVFQACMACHSIKPGEHMTGPSLADVWNRKAGTAEGFSRYSPALKGASVTWNASSLGKWLTAPQKFIAGTSMTFPGIRNARDRADVIAYLKAVSENKAPAIPQQGGMMGGGMRGMRSTRLDLRNAPPEGRVTALSYCGDTYTVKTADEKTQKVWEFNLRFKTDSSQDGPLPGKPVIVGAGMQGDRAAVIFAAPGEISAFIKPACP
ncbi:cytochrome c family protein [Herbaspirillum sp. HC18]|nr:cytochrome c family protein [Herbaspirillum sp. HC18]